MKINVLIVEDCPVMRLLIGRTLQLSGLEVGEITEAENGAEGLKYLKEKKIGLMIVDINMPVMDGLEMLEKIRKDPKVKEIPVLTVSTESNTQRVEFISKLSSGFVHKPFTPETLKKNFLKVLKEQPITKTAALYALDISKNGRIR